MHILANTISVVPDRPSHIALKTNVSHKQYLVYIVPPRMITCLFSTHTGPFWLRVFDFTWFNGRNWLSYLPYRRITPLLFAVFLVNWQVLTGGYWVEPITPLIEIEFAIGCSMEGHKITCWASRSIGIIIHKVDTASWSDYILRRIIDVNDLAVNAVSYTCHRGP